MTGRKAITMCHYKRPAYTGRVLEALRLCEGVGDYVILPHVEPGCDEVRGLIEAVDFAECLPTFNTTRQWVNLNTENALLDGFGWGDFVIHLEDDIVCAPDALRYYEWCRDRFADDPSVFSVTGYNRRPDPAAPDEFHRVARRRWFHPWGWATWRDRWETFSGMLHASRTGWDVILNQGFCVGGETPRCWEVYPLLSRSQNIGLVSSIRQDLSPDWYAENHYLRHWAADHGVVGGEFHE